MLEGKLQHAAGELNRIITTRVFTRGNDMIYELDHAERQLRLLRDSVFTLESNLRERVKLRYEKDLDQTRNELQD